MTLQNLIKEVEKLVEVRKGGPGSGRYPKGSGGGRGGSSPKGSQGTSGKYTNAASSELEILDTLVQQSHNTELPIVEKTKIKKALLSTGNALRDYSDQATMNSLTSKDEKEKKDLVKEASFLEDKSTLAFSTMNKIK